MSGGTGTGFISESRRTEIGKLEKGATILVDGEKQLIIEAEEGIAIFSIIKRSMGSVIIETCYMVTADGIVVDGKKYLSEISSRVIRDDNERHSEYNEELRGAGL